MNLIQHDPNYPCPEELLAVTKVGNVLFEGDTREETEGSNRIRDTILDDDPRLLFIQAWGGNNTIVRALLSIYETYHGTAQWNEIYNKVCSKVVFQKGMDQDNSWELNNMSEKFPDLMFMSTDVSLGYFLSKNADENVRHYFQADFLTENIKYNHGEMMSHYHLMGDGDVYPGEKDDMQYGLTTVIDWGFIRVEMEPFDWLGEGDSPMWVALVDVGLRGIESIDSYNYGSWAGRFSWTKANGEVIHAADLSGDYNYATGEMSNPNGGFFGGSTYSGNQFLEQFMLDWAARADWAVSAEANNPPVVSVTSKDMTAAAGEVVSLNGSATDPNGDHLYVKWWVYEAGGKYSGAANNLRVWNENKLTTKFTVPKDAKPGDYFNLILEVTDDAGEYSSFTRYAQVIVTVPGTPEEPGKENQPTTPDVNPQPKTYTVKSGDNLSKIAKKYLGSALKWKDIYKANKSIIKNPNLIFPGQVLVIP